MTLFRKKQFEVILTENDIVIRNNKTNGHAHFAKKYKNNKLDLSDIKCCISILIKNKTPKSAYFKRAIERLK